MRHSACLHCKARHLLRDGEDSWTREQESTFAEWATSELDAVGHISQEQNTELWVCRTLLCSTYCQYITWGCWHRVRFWPPFFGLSAFGYVSRIYRYWPRSIDPWSVPRFIIILSLCICIWLLSGNPIASLLDQSGFLRWSNRNKRNLCDFGPSTWTNGIFTISDQVHEQA